MTATIDLDGEKMKVVRWSKRGSCGAPGCADEKCRCGFCGFPIGIPEDDPRWEQHDADCGGCELCENQVPILLFRGSAPETEQAQFHVVCFNMLLIRRTA